MNQLEIACFSLDAIAIAQENGANRIELCLDRAAGGITPPFEMVQAARALTTVALNVMIRPREGDFVYTETEYQAMKNSIAAFKNLGVDGFVLGYSIPTAAFIPRPMRLWCAWRIRCLAPFTALSMALLIRCKG